MQANNNENKVRTEKYQKFTNKQKKKLINNQAFESKT